MSADTCPRCGRERGWGLTQCSPRDHESCLGFLRDRAERERDESRRELADAKAEVERLREQLRQHDSGVAGFIRWTGLQREADELRRLAWEWCIEARYHYSAANDAHRDAGELRAQLQRLTDDAYEVDHRGNYPKPPIESLMREEFTREEYDAGIESLGPVPLTEEHEADMRRGLSVGVPREMRTIAWLVRYALRRGARLEGE
jgi:hypothetical protein